MLSLPSWRMCCRPFSAHQSMASSQHACNSQGQRQTDTAATLIDKASSVCALLGFQALCPAIVAMQCEAVHTVCQCPNPFTETKNQADVKAATRALAMVADPCGRLRGLVQECLSARMPRAAVFFADKLLTLSKGSLADTYLLAQVLSSSPQQQRLHACMRSAPAVPLIRLRIHTRSASTRASSTVARWRCCAERSCLTLRCISNV